MYSLFVSNMHQPIMRKLQLIRLPGWPRFDSQKVLWKLLSSLSNRERADGGPNWICRRLKYAVSCLHAIIHRNCLLLRHADHITFRTTLFNCCTGSFCNYFLQSLHLNAVNSACYMRNNSLFIFAKTIHNFSTLQKVKNVTENRSFTYAYYPTPVFRNAAIFFFSLLRWRILNTSFWRNLNVAALKPVFTKYGRYKW